MRLGTTTIVFANTMQIKIEQFLDTSKILNGKHKSVIKLINLRRNTEKRNDQEHYEKDIFLASTIIHKIFETNSSLHVK